LIKNQQVTYVCTTKARRNLTYIERLNKTDLKKEWDQMGKICDINSKFYQLLIEQRTLISSGEYVKAYHQLIKLLKKVNAIENTESIDRSLIFDINDLLKEVSEFIDQL
jgi:hypothetical protein